MDTASFLQIVYISVGIVLIAVGILLVFILYEIYQAVKKFRRVLSRGDSLLNFFESRVLRPSLSVAEYAGLAKELLSLGLAFKKSLGKEPKEKKDE